MNGLKKLLERKVDNTFTVLQGLKALADNMGGIGQRKRLLAALYDLEELANLPEAPPQDLIVGMFRDKSAIYYQLAEKQELKGGNAAGTEFRKLAANYLLTASCIEKLGLESYAALMKASNTTPEPAALDLLLLQETLEVP